MLGVVITMGAIDGPPAEIGHKVAAALVGTFLGILLAYGFVQPLATNLEQRVADEAHYEQCIKAGAAGVHRACRRRSPSSSRAGAARRRPADLRRDREARARAQRADPAGGGLSACHKTARHHHRQEEGGHGGHHGGAWKVAYADFVTAMMAFFLVMWIVGQSQQVKAGVAGYFRDPGVLDNRHSTGILPGSTTGIDPDAQPTLAAVPLAPVPATEGARDAAPSASASC